MIIMPVATTARREEQKDRMGEDKHTFLRRTWTAVERDFIA